MAGPAATNRKSFLETPFLGSFGFSKLTLIIFLYFPGLISSFIYFMQQSRVSVLDSFRAIAIFYVMLYHFFSNNPPVNFPYGATYDYFRNGTYGVQFFFIISGFVIYYTLNNTAAFKRFWANRLIRLYPSIVIVSIIIFIVFCIYSKYTFETRLIKLSTSLSLLNPEILNVIIHPTIKFSYLDYSNWSLWPEIQFYLLASTLYFLNPKRFFRNYIIVSCICILYRIVILNTFLGSNILHWHLPVELFSFYQNWFDTLLTLPTYITYFTLGVCFYELYKNKTNFVKSNLFIFFYIAIIFSIELHAVGGDQKIILVAMLLLFISLVYFPKMLRFLDTPILNKIGVASYFIYLIHQYIGLILIQNYSHFFKPHYFIFTLLMIAAFCMIGIWYTQNVDKKIIKYLRRKYTAPS